MVEKSIFQGMDIYLIDQIMKGRYAAGECILDAGAGNGRNLRWFLDNDFSVTACDRNESSDSIIKERFPGAVLEWFHCDISNLPFDNESFHHVLCNAVLHFAADQAEFRRMFSELVRVTSKGGSIFIRTCSDIGLEGSIEALGSGRFRVPDGTERFLLTRNGIKELLESFPLELLEPVKSVNVSDQRVMTTLVLSKSH